jgi:hypothetical protein
MVNPATAVFLGWLRVDDGGVMGELYSGATRLSTFCRGGYSCSIPDCIRAVRLSDSQLPHVYSNLCQKTTRLSTLIICRRQCVPSGFLGGLIDAVSGSFWKETTDQPPQRLNAQCLRALFGLRLRIPFGASIVRLESWNTTITSSCRQLAKFVV